MADQDNKQDPGKKDSSDGTDPTKTDNEDSKSSFDPSKLSDEDISKVFTDKRVWTHERFKTLKAKADKADEFEAEKAEADNKSLEEQKKFKELADKHKADADSWKSKYQELQIDSKIQAEATKQGVTDPDAATKLVNRSGIKVTENGEVEGLTEAVTKMVEERPYLKTGTPTQPNVGEGTNPPAEGSEPSLKFKASQLSDPKFYKEHEKEIDQALRLNQIEDDLPPEG